MLSISGQVVLRENNLVSFSQTAKGGYRGPERGEGQYI